MHEPFLNSRAVRAIVAALALVGLAACGERIHSKQARSSEQAKPQEGDNHSYSSLAPETPQKAQGKNTADQRSAQ